MELRPTFNQITIVIPTRNRFLYVNRLLAYYKSFNKEFRILILDSSSNSTDESFLKTAFFPLDVGYRYFSEDILFWRKICSGINDVQTPYVALCADDDFLVPSGIEGVIDFLEREPSYGVAQGWYINHSIGQSGGFMWEPCRVNQESMDTTDVLSRFRKYYSGHGNPFYAVYRTKVAQKVWNGVVANSDDLFSGEMLVRGLTIICCRVKVLPFLFSSREISGVSYADERIFERTYGDSASIEKMRECLSLHLHSQGVQLEIARAAVMRVHGAFLARARQKLCRIKRGKEGKIFRRQLLSQVHRLARLVWYRIKYSLVLFLKSREELIHIRRAVLLANINSKALDKSRQEAFNKYVS